MNEAEFYANPENRRPVGPARRRSQKPQLSNHVPIRFAPETIVWIRTLAAREGMAVSSWVRAVVEREVTRRMPAAQTGGGGQVTVSLSGWRLPVETSNPTFVDKEPALTSA